MTRSTKGANLGGVLDFGGIKRRCQVLDDDPDSCWNWQGALDNRGMPKLWFAPFQATVTLSSVMCFLKTGKRPGRGAAWYACCDNRACGNPAHWEFGTLSQATRRHPRKNQALHTMKVAASRRAASKLTEAVVATIRAGTDTLKVCAANRGVSRSTVSRIRRGSAWKPLVLPGASVFDWRP